MTTITPPKLVVFGRDGVLNRYREDHVKEPSEWVPIPGALEAVARLNHAGWHAVVATNQAGIGRGMVDMTALNAVHSHMMKLLSQVGGRIDAVFFCPHTPQDNCDCRKPLPGMLLKIADRWGVELADVPMVGDGVRELLTAQAAGAQPHLVRTGRAAAASAAELDLWCQQVPATTVHANLGAFADHLLSSDASNFGSLPGPLSQ
jgi:D-glycero-D-manno-heptose 1,7-bisphosphate phosphatase